MSGEITGTSGIPRSAGSFNFAAENEGGTVWETRVPGTDSDETWESDDHQHRSLTDAVNATLPEYAKYGLSLESAAMLLLRLGLIVGTGVEVEEMWPDEQPDEDEE